MARVQRKHKKVGAGGYSEDDKGGTVKIAIIAFEQICSFFFQLANVLPCFRT